MAVFTSKASGNWGASGSTTWNEAGVPGAGDRVVINAGHALTVAANATVGHAPAAGDAEGAIYVVAGGTLTIAAGITFIVRGDIRLQNTTLTLAAGAVLEFDASAAASPSTAIYLLQIGTGHVMPNCKLICAGTSGSRCMVRSNAGGANARITDGGFIQAGQVDATYTTFTRIGDATHNSFETWAQGDEGTFHLTNCVLDACGTITTTALNQYAEFVLDGVTMKNTASGVCVATGTTDALTIPNGLRVITGCVFDKNLEIFPPTDFTIEHNVCGDRFICSNGVWASCTGNLFRSDTSSGTHDIPASLDDCYFLQDNNDGNPHFVVPNQDRDYTLDGCVFEYTGTGGDGDCILPQVPGSPRTITVKHCLVLPNAGGDNSGTLVTLGGNANITLVMEHNTSLAGTQGMLAVGETYAGHAGMVASFKNNLIWDTSARGYKLYDVGTDDAVPNLVTAANADYNGGHNLLAGSNLKGYHQLEFSSGAPGAHDVAGNPNFVDATRDLAAWDASLGGPGTVAHALQELGKRNDASGYDADYTIAALLTWVKAGFAPQEAAYEAASDAIAPSNGWIGAVEGAGAAAVTGTFAKTLAGVALSAVATVLAVGTLAGTLGAATLTATGTAVAGITGSVTATLAPMTGAGSTSSTVTGTLTRTLDGVGIAATGAIGPVLTGSLTQTLAPMTGAAIGTVSDVIVGTLTQPLAAATLTAAGTVTESGFPPEPIEEQILAACVARLTEMTTVVPGCWYPPKFVARAYRPLDAVNDLPGYLILRAPEESGMELQTIDSPGSAVIAAMGLEVLAYGQGSDVEPTDRVLIRLLAQAERALCAPGLFGPGAAPENQIELQNTRRVLDHETEVGAPYRSLMSHLYRVRYFYTRGEP